MYFLEQAKPQDLASLISLYRACGAHLLSQGYPNWGDFYPSEALVEADLEAGAIYWVRLSGAPLGAFSLDDKAPPLYAPVAWQHQGQAAYLHRLAVQPRHQHKGLGAWLLAQAETLALAQGAWLMRLDIYADNQGLQGFYEKAGYRSTGHYIELGEPWTRPFLCMEKKLF